MLKRGRNVAELDERRLRQEVRVRAAEARRLLDTGIPQARQILRKLLVGRLEVEAAVLPMSLSTTNLVTPPSTALRLKSGR